MGRSRAAWTAALLAPALLSGCQTWAALGRAFSDAEVELTLDRPADLLPPDGLRVTTTGDREIGLAWDPVLVGDVAGYAIARAQDQAETFEIVGRTSSRFGTVYVDRGEGEERLGDGETYQYRVHPYDPEGRVSRSHAHISATTEERPEAPLGLRAHSSLPRRVVLVWDPSEQRSVTGYLALRSPTVAGPWERIGAADGRLNTVYEDRVPGDLRVMYYRIIAVNRFGGESDETEPVRAVTKAEPLPPVGLRVEARRLGRVELGWTPNVEADLRHYEVWRAVGDGDDWGRERRIGEVAAPAAVFEDTEVGCGERVRYRLRVVDRDELTSEYSKPLAAVGEDLGLELATGPGGESELVWDPERASGWAGARVVHVRRVLPDREIDVDDGSHRAPLGDLGSGERRLVVILTARTADGDSAASALPDAPPCEVSLRLP